MKGRAAALMRVLHDEHPAAVWGPRRLTVEQARAEDPAEESPLRAWQRPEMTDCLSDLDGTLKSRPHHAERALRLTMQESGVTR